MTQIDLILHLIYVRAALAGFALLGGIASVVVGFHLRKELAPANSSMDLKSSLFGSLKVSSKQLGAIAIGYSVVWIIGAVLISPGKFEDFTGNKLSESAQPQPSAVSTSVSELSKPPTIQRKQSVDESRNTADAPEGIVLESGEIGLTVTKAPVTPNTRKVSHGPIAPSAASRTGNFQELSVAKVNVVNTPGQYKTMLKMALSGDGATENSWQQTTWDVDSIQLRATTTGQVFLGVPSKVQDGSSTVTWFVPDDRGTTIEFEPIEFDLDEALKAAAEKSANGQGHP